MVYRAPAFLICGLLSLVLLSPGCTSSDNDQPGGSEDGSSSSKTPSEAGSDQLAQAPGARPSGSTGGSQGSEQASSPNSRQGFIATLIDLLDQTDLEDGDRDELREELKAAEKTWQDIKAENSQAIRQVNRQVRASRTHSPNIILISMDGLGHRALGSYGQQKIPTPNLDRMAEQGIRFTNYYAGSSAVVPGHCTTATGLDTGHCRLRGNTPALPLLPEDVTLAEMLWQAGYSTGMIGHWALGQPGSTGMPHLQGFEYSFGYLGSEEAKNPYPPRLWRNGQEVPLDGNAGGRQAQLAQSLFTKEALTFITRNVRAPFFLRLAFTQPSSDTAVPQGNPARIDVDWTGPQRNYAGVITRLDDDVQKIIDQLQQLKLDKHTVILLGGSNGPERNATADFFSVAAPLNGGQGSLQEGGIRVPMIAWSGPHEGPARVSDHPWAAWDMVPTLADLVMAIRRPRGLSGVSQIDLLRNQLPSGPLRALYWELHRPRFTQAMRWGDWSATRGSLTGGLQLFNLLDDPAQQNNVAADNPEVIKSILTHLQNARVKSSDWPVAGR